MRAISTFQSDRSFTLLSYAHSHGIVLMRSKRTKESNSEIYIMIKDVRAMEARMWFEGIAIAQEMQDYLTGFRSKPSAMVDAGNKIYSLSGRDWEGFIVGGAMFLANTTDDLEALYLD